MLANSKNFKSDIQKQDIDLINKVKINYINSYINPNLESGITHDKEFV